MYSLYRASIWQLTRLEDIVQILAERLVHNDTGRPLTPLAVESALKGLGFSVCLWWLQPYTGRYCIIYNMLNF